MVRLLAVLVVEVQALLVVVAPASVVAEQQQALRRLQQQWASGCADDELMTRAAFGRAVKTDDVAATDPDGSRAAAL